jgi:hypothetical protein
MVEIRYGDQFEVSDLAGQTVSEAREQFKADFGIPDKAKAKLNGSKVKSGAELDTVLNDDDKVTFAVSRSRMPYLIGALLLALAVTGGVFAFGFVNSTTTINATVYESNFADVSVNNSFASPAFNSWGFFKGTIPAGSLFNVTPGTNYTGDLSVTVSLGNADALSQDYRALSLQLAMVYTQNGSYVDVNESTNNGSGDSNSDWVMLTLDNGSVTMFPQGTATGAQMTVLVKRGFYITHVHPNGNWQGSASPEIFCEVAQR